jgi:hypothetical protein
MLVLNTCSLYIIILDILQDLLSQEILNNNSHQRHKLKQLVMSVWIPPINGILGHVFVMSWFTGLPIWIKIGIF